MAGMAGSCLQHSRVRAGTRIQTYITEIRSAGANSNELFCTFALYSRCIPLYKFLEGSKTFCIRRPSVYVQYCAIEFAARVALNMESEPVFGVNGAHCSDHRFQCKLRCHYHQTRELRLTRAFMGSWLDLRVGQLLVGPRLPL